MITFKLLDSKTSKDCIAQINPNHIVSAEYNIDTYYITELDCNCHIANTTYELITNMQLRVIIIAPVEEHSRERFIEYLKNGSNFYTTFINWSK